MAVVNVDLTGVLKLATDWFTSASARLRDRKTQMGAKILFHAGVVTVAMQAIRDEMNAQLSELQTFNPGEWDADRRRTRIDTLRTFVVDTSRSFGLLNTHAAALRQLRTEPKKKPEIHKLIREIADLAEELNHGGDHVQDEIVRQRGAEQSWAQGIDRYLEQGMRAYGAVSVQGRSNDLLMVRFLPALLWLVGNAHEDQEVDALRRLAAGLMVTRTRYGDRNIDALVTEVQKAFGELGGSLDRLYPEIGIPVWAGTMPE